MTYRINLSEVKDRISAIVVPEFSGLTVGTHYDRDYLSTFGRVYPKIWVRGQRVRPRSDGRKEYGGLIRQHSNVDVGVSVHVQRYLDPAPPKTQEQVMTEICDALAESLVGWAPVGASEVFVLGTAQDGPASEGILSVDMFFTTTVTNQKEG